MTANATLGPAVDGVLRPVAAGALVLAISAGAVAGGVVGNDIAHPRQDPPDVSREPVTHGQRRLVGAGVLGAGTMPVLTVQGASSQRCVPAPGKTPCARS